MVAGAATDAIGHFMASSLDFLELGVMRLIHAEMESKCLVGIRHTREMDGCIRVGRFPEGERFGRVVHWNRITIRIEFPRQQVQFSFGEFDGTTKNGQ